MELALVQIVGDKRPVTVYDLTDGIRLRRRRETTRITVDSEDESRATVSGVWSIQAQTATELPALIQEFTRRIQRPGTDEFVEWKTPPSTYPVYMKRLGAGRAQLLSTAWQHGLYRRAIFEVSIPVEVPARMLGLNVLDDFAANSLADYTFDTGSSTLDVANGVLFPYDTTTKRFWHSGRGHRYGDSQATIKYRTGAAVPSTGNAQVELILKRLDSSNELRGKLWANSGGSAQLSIDKLDGGVVSAFAGATSFTALTAATAYWFRFRIEGNVMVVEHWTAQPTPMGTPAQTFTFTLTGADATKFGTGIQGYAGAQLRPTATTWNWDDFEVKAFVYKNQTLPARIQMSGLIPGDEKALVDLHVTPSGGSAAPVAAIVGWSDDPLVPSGSALVPLGPVEAEADVSGDRATWAIVADAGARGGNVLQATTSGAGTASAHWLLDPSALAAKESTPAEMSFEVFAVVKLDAGVVAPKLTLSARPNDGTSFGAERFSEEYGTAGKLLTRPSSGTVKRPVRLGTVRLSVDPNLRPLWKLRIAGAWAAGSSGAFGLDYLFIVPALRRAASPQGLANDSAFPKFAASTSETTRVLLCDGTGQVAKPPNAPIRDVGLGAAILLEPGESDLAVKLSSLSVDDPTSDASTEQLAHSATVHCRVIPRVSLLRGS